MLDENISTALVLEDDVGWDIRIKSQMQDFAKASRLLIQPKLGTSSSYLDPTNPRHADESVAPATFDIDQYSGIIEPTTSPYSDIDR